MGPPWWAEVGGWGMMPDQGSHRAEGVKGESHVATYVPLGPALGSSPTSLCTSLWGGGEGWAAAIGEAAVRTGKTESD